MRLKDVLRPKREEGYTSRTIMSSGSFIGYLIGAAAAGYLAYLQLDAGNLINQLGHESSGYRSSDFYGYVLNGISATTTVYFGFGSS